MNRELARAAAAGAYRAAIGELFDLAEARIEWRRANANLLALEARAMIAALASDPASVPFRRLRIAHWRRVERKHAARAKAQNQILAERCDEVTFPGGA